VFEAILTNCTPLVPECEWRKKEDKCEDLKKENENINEILRPAKPL
jgi:hypothetical protein